jgi:uncharacterized protein (TIGR01244 family)
MGNVGQSIVSSLTRNWVLGVLLTATLTGGMAKAEPASGSAPLIAIPNARQPAPSVLTGGQPTRAQLEEAAGAGYKTVVNLRTLSEDGAWDEREFVTQLGMRFVHLPVSGARDVNRKNAAALREILRDAEAQPVLVHCASGNRIGALFAVGASLFDGATVDNALELGRDAGLTRLEPATREYLLTQAPN